MKGKENIATKQALSESIQTPAKNLIAGVDSKNDADGVVRGLKALNDAGIIDLPMFNVLVAAAANASLNKPVVVATRKWQCTYSPLLFGRK